MIDFAPRKPESANQKRQAELEGGVSQFNRILNGYAIPLLSLSQDGIDAVNTPVRKALELRLNQPSANTAQADEAVFNAVEAFLQTFDEDANVPKHVTLSGISDVLNSIAGDIRNTAAEKKY